MRFSLESQDIKEKVQKLNKKVTKFEKHTHGEEIEDDYDDDGEDS